MKIVECRGSDTKIGRTIGEALREEIQANVRGFLPAELSVLDGKIASFHESMKRFLPEVLEQMLQAAKAAGVTDKQMLALNAPSGESDPNFYQGCSNVVFAAGPDGPLWGKNNEGRFPPTDQPVVDAQGPRPVCALKLYPKQGIPAICFTFCGWFSGADMINAEGVATGHSSVGSKFQQSPRHVSVLQWLWRGMFEIRGLADYVNHVTAQPLRGKGFSQIVVDRHGQMASGELACPLAQIRWPAEGAMGMNCVNHYQLPTLEKIDARQPEGLVNSKGRQAYLDEAIVSGDQSLAHLKNILRRHGEFSICRHGGRDACHTEYSMIGIPNQRKALLYHGYPCEGEYQEISI
ncbi:MAG: hypothetical protein JXA11_00345 [Phycisphaerae bacterium]|nr:hypothetical protein [Phycisphaerae bacterium]